MKSKFNTLQRKIPFYCKHIHHTVHNGAAITINNDGPYCQFCMIFKNRIVHRMNKAGE